MSQTSLDTQYTAAATKPRAEPRIALPCERLQVVWKRIEANYDEDVAVITIHFGAPGGGLLSDTAHQEVEAQFTAFWNTNRALFADMMVLDQYRWYDQRVYPTKSPLLRATDITDVPATGAGTQLPPQTACSVTLETDTRRRWGRFYLPTMTSGNLTAQTGRFATTTVDAIAQAMVDWLNFCKTAGAEPLVYSPRGGKGPPVFEAGSTEPVTGIRVDDIVDTVRRRRFQDNPYRKRFILA